MAQPK